MNRRPSGGRGSRERHLNTDGGTDEAGAPCTVAYDVAAEETEEEVRVTFLGRRPKPPAGSWAGNDMGHGREALVELERPFDDRRLVEVQFDREQPVFDGSMLREPAARDRPRPPLNGAFRWPFWS